MAKGNIKTFKMPEQLGAEAKREMKRSGMTQSELYRAALRRYLEQQRRFRAVQEYGIAAAKRAGFKTEEEIIQAAVQVRRERKGKRR